MTLGTNTDHLCSRFERFGVVGRLPPDVAGNFTRRVSGLNVLYLRSVKLTLPPALTTVHSCESSEFAPQFGGGC